VEVFSVSGWQEGISKFTGKGNLLNWDILR
jgi:hypothetical protein